ncbi:MAG: formate dehydrogenase accessory protein FdhE [Anaerolineales bacterium]
MLKRLDTLAQHTPELAEPLAFYRVALPLLRKAQAKVAPFTLDPETAQRKLASGQPLLVGEDLPLDPAATRDLFIRLCHVAETTGTPALGKPGGRSSLFSRGRPDPLKLMERAHSADGAALRSVAARQIRRAVERNELDLAAVWEALAGGDWRRMELTAVSLQLDAGLLRALAQYSLRPALRAWAQALRGQVDLERWLRGGRGPCPMCGSPPTLAEIQGKEGARRLRCGLCGADWSFPRLRCAFCGNQDYKSLGYISVEGEEEKYRLQTCDACRGYLKIVVTYEPTPVDLLPVEDLATLHLDLIANEREFMRVPVR